MKSYKAASVLAAVLVMGLTGCGAKEREQLQLKVAGLEQEVTALKTEVANKDAQVMDEQQRLINVSTQLSDARAQIQTLTDENEHLKTTVTKLKAQSKPVVKKKV